MVLGVSSCPLRVQTMGLLCVSVPRVCPRAQEGSSAQSSAGFAGLGPCSPCCSSQLPGGCPAQRALGAGLSLCVWFHSVWKFHTVPNGCHFRGDCNAAVCVLFAWVAAGVQASFQESSFCVLPEWFRACEFFAWDSFYGMNWILNYSSNPEGSTSDSLILSNLCYAVCTLSQVQFLSFPRAEILLHLFLFFFFKVGMFY